jgi:hypothetical protein
MVTNCTNARFRKIGFRQLVPSEKFSKITHRNPPYP